jgi:hypothetical protein
MSASSLARLMMSRTREGEPVRRMGEWVYREDVGEVVDRGERRRSGLLKLNAVWIVA